MKNNEKAITCFRAQKFARPYIAERGENEFDIFPFFGNFPRFWPRLSNFYEAKKLLSTDLN